MKTLLKNTVKGFYWSLYGRTARNPVLPSKVRSILFICKGNICRSPFAEHIAKKILEERSEDLEGWDISSAGIRVGDPEMSPTEAVISAKQYGVDLAGHRSRPIRYEMMESFDMIVAMETGQYKYLKKLFLEYENKVYLLPLFDVDDSVIRGSYLKYNVQDPYGRTLENFIECFDRISKCVAQVLSNAGINTDGSRDNK